MSILNKVIISSDINNFLLSIIHTPILSNIKVLISSIIQTLILSLSKDEGFGFEARTLRQAQGEGVLF